MDVLIGADPEVFVKTRGRRKYVSAHGMVKGDKQNPYKVPNGAVQVDGMALEFNIDPARTEDEFVKRIDSLKTTLREMIGEKYNIAALSHVEFDKKVWEMAPLEAKELGCDPDFNAWKKGDINPKPETDLPMRTGAGHIHIGWGKDMPIEHESHKEACHMLVKQLDCYVGMKSIYMDPSNVRRTLYGEAGAYRPKSYGCEYRVLSNYWVRRRTFMREVYKDVRFCVDELEKGNVFFLERGFGPRSRYFPPKMMKTDGDKFPFVYEDAKNAVQYIDERFK